MRIVYIAKSLIPSRTANSLHIMKMCQAFADNGHEVELFVLSEKKQSENDIERIYRYYSVKNNFKITWMLIIETKESSLRYLLSSFVLSVSIICWLLFKRCDLIYGRDLLGCTVSALIGKKTIFESHAPIWRNKLEGVLFTLLIRLPSFSKLVVISDALRQAYLSRYTTLNSTNTLIAHDAADIPDKTITSKPLQGDLTQLNVGYVGHLYKGKGVEVIAAIASKLPDVNFHIIGGFDWDITYWKSKISSPNVFFYGFIKQGKLADYIHHLDICLLPNQRHISAFGANADRSKNISDYTSPLKMFEYMAYEKPIIASDLPVLREVLDERVAILVDPEDSQGWINAINHLKDNNLCQRLATAAHYRFIKNYTWKQRAKQVLVNS